MLSSSKAKARVGYWWAAMIGGLLFHTAPASAQEIHLAWPELGFGPGGYVFNGNTGAGLQLDLSIGFEREGDPWRVLGGLIRTDFLILPGDGGGINDVDSLKFDIVALFTTASSFDYGKPFVRLGAGPLTSFTNVDAEEGIGFGLLGEVTAGFKGMFALSFDLRTSLDAVGFTLGAGLVMRINPFFFRFFDRRGYSS